MNSGNPVEFDDYNLTRIIEVPEFVGMNDYAGLGSALSVAIVVVFAVAFHERDQPTTSLSPSSHAISQAKTPRSPVAKPGTEVASDSTRAAEQVATRVALISDQPRQPRPLDQPVSVRPRLIAPPASGPTVGDRPPPRLRPASAKLASPSSLPTASKRLTTTVVEPGESIADVAIRVYGTAEAIAKLWRANRDRLSSASAPVEAGWLLRTP